MRLLLPLLALLSLSLAALPVVPPARDVRSELVIGGHRAYQGSFPYYAYLHFCGGSLITPTHILTAAHCVSDFWIGEVMHMGVDDQWDLKKKGVQNRTVIDVITHGVYNDTTKQNDIAILEVDKAYDITPYAQLAKIKADDSELLKEYWTTGVGFGMTNVTRNDDGTLSGVWPQYLQYAYIPLISEDKCAQVWGRYLNEKHQQLCVGGENLGLGSGDSGGPVSVTKDGEVYQIGIASFNGLNRHFNQDKVPAVLTRASSYCDWMTEKTNGAFHCV
uniref:Peptidase S1 domain-containing protein n=1 Tax=Steinernema glaseri TaxID=37863 RepID=A0A1I7ZDW7_9BILA